MPQGPAHLHRLWGDDWNAWLYLKRRGFTKTRGGVILPPHRHHRLTSREEQAVDYLFMEWDYAYAPPMAPETPLERSMLSSWGRWLLCVFSGPLRVRDKLLWSTTMWWHCEAKYEIRRKWAKLRGQPWDEEDDDFWEVKP